MKKCKSVLFRADAGRRWGNGHLMRCLALGQALRREGVRVVFVSHIESADLIRRMHQENITLVLMKRRRLGGELDAHDTAALAKKWRADWVVVDGRQFSHPYQQRLVSSNYRLMLIDDHGNVPSPANFILNQNLHAHRGLYAKAKDSTLLLGPKHVLLRPEFTHWRHWVRPITPVGKKILITMGGSDPEDSTGKALQAVTTLESRLEVIVVVGEHYQFSRRLMTQAKISPHRVRIIRGTDRIARLMAWADLGISTFGTTSWEMAFMGLPAVSLVVEAHQKPFANALARQGALLKIDMRSSFPSSILGETVRRVLLSQRVRQSLSRRGRALVDGQGNQRIMKAMGLTRNLK